jgi:hypothetical protein
MKASSLFRSMRMAALALAAVFSVFAFTTRVFADDLPTFSDPDVNTFVKSYAQFVDNYIEALKAAKTGDNSKLANVQTKATELQAQATQATGKLKADETETFQKFLTTCTAKITDASK